MQPEAKNSNPLAEQRNASATPDSTITVNVGLPGKIRKLVLEGTDWTVKDVLKYAEIDSNGYELRAGGQPVSLNSKVTDGQTILLLRAVVGN